MWSQDCTKILCRWDSGIERCVDDRGRNHRFNFFRRSMRRPFAASTATWCSLCELWHASFLFFHLLDLFSCFDCSVVPNFFGDHFFPQELDNESITCIQLSW